MSGVDHSDQMISYHSSLRKTTRWYKKIGFRILELLLFNAYKIYVKETQSTMTELEFREIIVKHITGPVSDRSILTSTAKFHFLEPIPSNDRKQYPTRTCRQCAKQNLQKESRYRCGKCTDHLALCVHPCFRVYHQQCYITE